MTSMKKVKCFYCKKKNYNVLVDEENNTLHVVCSKCGNGLLNISQKTKQDLRTSLAEEDAEKEMEKNK